MTRRRLLRLAAAGAAGAPWWRRAAAAAAAPRDRRPDVLLVTVDDLNLHLGCYGHRVVKSPNIDRLAARGVRFERAYAQFPVCNPSRSSFLTGLYPETTGVLDNRKPLLKSLPDAMTLPRWFRRHGYFTASVGKIFHGGSAFGDAKGWDVELHPKMRPAGRKGRRRNLTGGRIKWCWWLAAEGTDADQADGQVAAEAAAILRQKRDRPLLLAVGFHKPHDPFIAPKRYFDLYPLGQLTPPQAPAGRGGDLPLAISGAWKEEFDKFTDRERKEFMRAYYAGVSFMDAQLGKVLDALAASGRAENTVIVFLSDHGYHLGERGWWNKNTLFELSCRVPLIVAAPQMGRRRVAGKSARGIVELLDVLPTLTDLCALPTPAHQAGRSFRPLLVDPTGQGKPAAYTVANRGKAGLGRSIRTERYRYTEWDHGRGGRELYDHARDEGEWNNLADSPPHAETVRTLRELLRQREAVAATRAGKSAPDRVNRLDRPGPQRVR